MDKTFGLIVIGVILLAIVSAFIFSSNFRKDVIASEGEAAVLGIINVKGVIIVLLTGIFGALFVYILQLDTGSGLSGQEITAAIALDYLRDNRNKEKYEIKKEGNRVSIKHLDEEYTIGELPDNRPDDHSKTPLTAIKDTNDLYKWYISHGGSNLGNVSLDFDQDKIITSPENVIMTYRFNKAYRIGDLDFWFIIDDVDFVDTVKSLYTYRIRFGEEEPQNNIIGNEMVVEHPKSKGGKIIEIKRLQHRQWKNNYYVALGLGQPGHTINDKGEKINDKVEMLNIIAVKAKLE